MSASGGAVDPLGEAAGALDAELRRYEELAATMREVRLDSEKGLRRASQTLAQLQASDARLVTLVQTLVAAVGAASVRQQALAETVRTCAARVAERSAALTGLLGHWEALGVAAAEVNALLQHLDRGAESNGVDGDASLRTIDARLTRLADEAQTLAEQAVAAEFPDLGREAAGLRHQLLNAANKVRLLLGGGETGAG